VSTVAGCGAAVDVAVITRSQSVAMHREAELQTPLESDPDVSPADIESNLADNFCRS